MVVSTRGVSETANGIFSEVADWRVSPQNPVPRLLVSAREAAEMLSICERSLRNYTAPRGTIPSLTIGTRRLYEVDTLRRWVESQKSAPAPRDDENNDQGGPSRRKGAGQ